jgi:hypothetical protein
MYRLCHDKVSTKSLKLGELNKLRGLNTEDAYSKYLLRMRNAVCAQSKVYP